MVDALIFIGIIYGGYITCKIVFGDKFKKYD